MTDEQRWIDNLEKAVAENRADLMEQTLRQLDGADIAPDVLLQALNQGLTKVRNRLENHASPIVEYLMAVDLMRRGLTVVGAVHAQRPPRGCAVIGVIKGDVHDLGKNIVASVLNACGFEVVDAGADVAVDEFASLVRKNNATILAISTMMSTTFDSIRQTVSRCKAEFPELRILVGGAPLDESVARQLGADGFTETAAGLPGVLDELVPPVERNGKRNGETHRAYTDYYRKVKVTEVGGAPPSES